MSLVQKLFNCNKGMQLGKHLIDEDWTIQQYRDYFASNEINSSFKVGYCVSYLYRQHLSYSELNNLISPNHPRYGDKPNTLLIRSGPNQYFFTKE
jgi:hypothetical protein